MKLSMRVGEIGHERIIDKWTSISCATSLSILPVPDKIRDIEHVGE